MNKSMSFSLALLFLIIGVHPSIAHEQGTARPQLLLREFVQGMPKGKLQEVSVLTASFKPGEKTVFHSHRFPVAVYILEGAFTLELEGRGPSRNCRSLSAHGDTEDAAKSADGSRRAERRPGSDPPESQPAAGDVDRNGDLRIVAYVADRRATDQPGCADVEGFSDLQIDRERLILRPGVAEHYKGADNHCDAHHNRSCPHVPPRGQDMFPEYRAGAERGNRFAMDG